MKILIQLILAMAFLMSIIGCSNHHLNPVTPSNDQSSIPEIVPSIGTDPDGHAFLGAWMVDFDLKTMEAIVTPDRYTNAHFNITPYLPYPQIRIISYDPIKYEVEVSVTIRNTYSISGRDVRLIIYTDSVGHMLKNADNWTPLYDISGGDTINPFKAYAKSVANRDFGASTSRTENCIVYIPGGNTQVRLAIDASYPGNCGEPYQIENFSYTELNYPVGSQSNVSVYIHDWQNDVSEVYLNCPEITGGPVVNFNPVGGDKWEGIITNNTGAAVGDYNALLIATSSTGGLVYLYQYLKILVSPLAGSGWAKTWGGTSIDGASDVAVDRFGNIYVIGSFQGSVDFDPGSGSTIKSSLGQSDAYLSKFNSEGIFQWVVKWGSFSSDSGDNVATDCVGNIYVAGTFSATVDFDPGPGTKILSSNGDMDCYLCKYNSSGVLQWAVSWGGSTWDTPGSIKVDNADDIYVCGAFKDTVDFDPANLTSTEATSNGDYDCFLSKFDTYSNFRWVRTWGGMDYDFAHGLATGPNGNIYVSGKFGGSVDFDPGAGNVIKTSNGDKDIFVSIFNKSGAFNTVQAWGGVDLDESFSVCTDSSGNYFVTGSYKGTVDFDPGPGSYMLGPSNGSDIYLSKFSSGNALIWAFSIGGSGNDWGLSVTVDGLGNVCLAGSFFDQVDFDPGPGVTSLVSNGSSDAFCAQYNTSSNLNWARSWGGTGGETSEGMFTNAQSNNYIAGKYQFNVDFDPGPGTDMHTGNSFHDCFLMKLKSNGNW